MKSLVSIFRQNNRMALIGYFRILILSTGILGLFNLSSCTSTLDAGTESPATNQFITAQTLEEFPIEDLNEDEIDGLIFMREEEKLARDVYIVMYNKWSRRVFSNISESEQRHMDALRILLDRYELDDPVEENSLGVFENETLQNLYNTLIEQGSGSLIEALNVGALIEEIDIIDIQNELDENVDNRDINFVYQNLLNGSYNHLRAFTRNLSRQGVDYEPHKLSAEVYLEILSSERQRGRY